MYVVHAHEYREWEKLGLEDFGQYSDKVDYINQRESGYDDMEGEWYYCPDPSPTQGVIYGGTHGNDHSPGCSHRTCAEVYDLTDPEDVAAYANRCKELTDTPEYLEVEDLYEVIVGNVGTVYSGDDANKADELYDTYVEQSKSGVGRAGGESVTMLTNSEVTHEFEGDNDAITLSEES